jgi:large subunit ribosomal protein L10
MDNPRPEKVAVVDEVRDRFSSSSAALLTEYRGLSVTDIQTLRRSLHEAGGDYKIYKNTLVRFAAKDLNLDIADLLVGPTAIAFVPTDGTGDPVPVAKVLKDFAKGNANLVLKGGVLGDRVLSADDTSALADVAPREVLLAQLAGAMAAPMQQFAGLLKAVPQSFAYAMQALIDQGGAPGAPVAEVAAETAAPTDAGGDPPSDPPTGSPSDSDSQTIDAPPEAVATDSGGDAGETTTEAN